MILNFYKTQHFAFTKGLFWKMILSLLILIGVINPVYSQISGLVFRDFNMNGARTTSAPAEPLVAGIIVNAYNNNNAIIASFTTTQGVSPTQTNYPFNGPNFSIPASGAAYNGTEGSNTGFVPAGVKVRIEFVIPTGGVFADKNYDFSGSKSSSVQFATSAPTTSLLFGLNTPADYNTGEANADIFIPRYYHGNSDLAPGDNSWFVGYPYAATATSATLGNPPRQLSGKQIGTVWGVAYSKQSGKIFTSAFIKRHSGMGPMGTGGIYMLTPTTGTFNLEPFYDLDANGYRTRASSSAVAYGDGSSFSLSGGNPKTQITFLGPIDPESGAPEGLGVVGTNTERLLAASTTINAGNYDPAAFDQVGKVSLGDIDISDDGKHLFVANLYSRRILRLTLNDAANPTAVIAVEQYDLPTSVTAVNGVLRPFGLKFKKGKLYVGATATGENEPTNTDSNLAAHVFELNNATGAASFNTTPVLTVPLNFVRGSAHTGAKNRWLPWEKEPAAQDLTRSASDASIGILDSYPSPMFSDIEFTDRGDMILGISDRTGHQHGWGAVKELGPTGGNLIAATSGGDYLIAGINASGGWTLEDARVISSGGVNFTGTGATTHGPGGREFFDDNHSFHQETAQGAMAVLPGSAKVKTSRVNPAGVSSIGQNYSGGTGDFSTTNGAYINASGYRLYNRDIGGYGKAHGLGDIELLTPLAPIEVGNYIWHDANRNGIQDPSESFIAGVTLELLNSVGTVLGTTTSDASGQYFFNSATTTGLAANETYSVRITSLGTHPSVSGLLLTDLTLLTPGESGSSNSGNTVHNNDGVLEGGYPTIHFTTGEWGENNHTYDFGFGTCPDFDLEIASPSTQEICANETPSAFTASHNLGGSAYYRWYGPLSSTSGSLGTAISGATSSAFTPSGVTAGTHYYAVVISDSEDFLCTDTSFSTLIVNVAPNPTVSQNASICAGQTTTLTAAGCTSGFSYLWSNNATTPSIIVNAAGTYTVKCIQTGGSECESAIPGTVNVTINTGPVITMGTPTCAAGTPTYSIPFNVTSGATITSSVGNIIDVVGGKTLTRIPPGTEVIITATLDNCTVTEVFTSPSTTCFCIGAKSDGVSGDIEVCYGDTIQLPSHSLSTEYFQFKIFNSQGTELTPGDMFIVTESTYFLSRGVGLVPECEDGDNAMYNVTMKSRPTIVLDGSVVCNAEGTFYSASFTIPSGATLSATTAGTISGNSVIDIPSGASATVTVESAEGCQESTTVTHSCFVCIAPNPTVSQDISICSGSNTTLTAAGCTTGFTYLWSTGATTESINVSPSTTAQYTVSCVSSTDVDCKSVTPAEVEVTVMPLPVITINAATCRGGDPNYSVTFTVSSGAVVTSSVGVVNGSTITGIPSGVTATVTATLNGCSVQALTSPTTCTCIGGKPDSYLDPLIVCYGDTINLNFNGSTTEGYHTYKWFTSGGTEILPGDVLIATENTQLSHGWVSTAAGCEDGDRGSLDITVNPAPTISFAPPVCSGDALSYSVEFTIPIGATLLTTTAGSISGNSVINIPSGTPAIVTVESTEGCTNTITVTQNCTVPCNAPNPTVTGDLEICAGESTTLTASGCTTGYTYLWSTGATTAAITVTPTANTTYTVKCVETGRPECESINPGSATVVVNPRPTITAGSLICMNDGLTFYVNFTIPTGATLSTDYGNVYGRQVSGIPAGATATVTVTDPKGCQNTTTVTRDCTPICETPNGVDGNRSICPGETIDLMSFVDPEVGLESEWFYGGVLLTNTVVTPVEDAIYVHYYVPKEGCVPGGKGQIEIHFRSVPTITAGTPVCAPDGQTYSVTFTIPAGATITTTAGTVTGNVVSGIASGVTSTITVTSAEGCINTTTVMQNCTVPCNAPNPTVTGDLEICTGENTTLTASGCTTGYTYLWSTGATTAAITVTPTANTTYTVKCVETGRPECESINPGSASVVVNPIPTITAGTPVCTTDGLTYSVTFTIPVGATITTTAGTVTGNVVSGINSGVTATITVTSAEGCTNTTTVTQNCTVSVFDLALRKVLPNGAKNLIVTPGSTVTFKIEVWNQGNVDAQNVAVIDYIPNGLTLVADANWTAGTGVATLTTPIASLAAGDSTSVNISFTVNSGFTGSIRNFAEISEADNIPGLPDVDSTPDSNPDNDGTPKDDNISENHKNNPTQDEDDHDYEDITVSPTPVFDLALRKVLPNGAKNPIVTPGSTVTFKIEVWNQGNVDAQNVVVTDYIPNGLTLVADANWTAGTGVATLTTPIPSLAAGDSTSVNISFTVDTGFSGSIRNFAEISDADNIAGLEDIDSTPDSNPGNDGTPKDDVVNEDHKNNPTQDEDDHDYEDIIVSPTPVFDLALRKTMGGSFAGLKNPVVTPGSTVTFKIEVWNQGNVDAQNVALVDYIPSSLTLADTNWVAGGGIATLANPIALLAAGDSMSVNITFVVNAGFSGSIRNFAEISDADNTLGLEDIDSTPDSNPGNDGAPKDDVIVEDHKTYPNDDEDDHDFEEITVSPTPVFDLALRKVLANGAKNPTVSIGDTITFRLDVFNQGNVDATDIEIDDTIPSGLTLADTNWTETGGIASLNTAIAALAAGDSTAITITFTINASASGTIRNVARITGYENEFDLEDIDSDPNRPGEVDDEIDERGKDGEDEDSNDFEEINITSPIFDLALRKTMAAGSKTIYKVGDQVTFDITVFNQGTVSATSVDLVDYIPAGLTLEAGANWTLDGDKARWTGAISNLAPGAQQTVQITFVVNASATGVIINIAEISGATNPQNLEDVDSTPDDDKDNDGPVKNDEINEDGKNSGDEDDHDIATITICLDAKCLNVKTTRLK